jgi:hypothetical protein
MIDGTRIEVASPAFVRHLAARLLAERRRSRRPIWLMASRSQGRFSARDLSDAEAGLLPLDPSIVVALAGLYGLDVAEVLPPVRRGLDIRPGTISAGGVTMPFTPGDSASLVNAYFALTRTLRSIDDEAAMPLRRNDVEQIAAYLSSQHAPSVYIDKVMELSSFHGQVIVSSVLAGAATLAMVGAGPESR